MALRSKNFIFRRIGKDGLPADFQDSDSWYITNPDYHWNEVSLPLASGGYYGSTSGLHTIAFSLQHFVGRIYVEATLASEPKEEDWFKIKFTECCEYFVEFNDTKIYDANSERVIHEYGTTGTFAENLIGNFTFLRVGIDRSYISIDPSFNQKERVGKLDEVQINF